MRASPAGRCGHRLPDDASIACRTERAAPADDAGSVRRRPAARGVCALPGAGAGLASDETRPVAVLSSWKGEMAGVERRPAPNGYDDAQHLPSHPSMTRPVAVLSSWKGEMAGVERRHTR